MRRRTVLLALGAGIGGLAGCLGGDSSGSDNGQSSDSAREETTAPTTGRDTPKAGPATNTGTERRRGLVSRPTTGRPTGTPGTLVDRTYDENAATAVTEYPLTRAVAVERGPADNWWVLEVSMEYDGLAAVYEYTPAWKPAGTATAFRLSVSEGERERDVVPTDLSPRSEGGWYVLGEDGTVYVFDANWNATGESTSLPRRSDWESAYRSYGFERASYGWWAFAYDRLVCYDPSFERVLASYHTARDLALGKVYYNEHYGKMTVAKIRELHLSADGSLVLRANLGRKFYVFDGPGKSGLESTEPSRVLSPDTNPPSGYALASETDGDRYVLRGNGTLYRYTADWEYAGERLRVGSGEAYDRYPPDSR